MTLYYQQGKIMHISKFHINEPTISEKSFRPLSFDEFIGQNHITRIITTAVSSAKKSDHYLWHILLCWPSGYGKTTLAQIISSMYGKKFHTVTGYAISKPAELISIMTSMSDGDVLFIDEIHRIKPILEEMLYIAMEDFAIDMVMPDGWSVRVPLKPFTLIGATTKPEALSEPLKNRFVYNFHCMDYSDQEKNLIIERYLKHYHITYETPMIDSISLKIDTVPRKIHNLVIKIRDFLISHHHSLHLDDNSRAQCEQRLSIKDGGLTPIHQQYLSILNGSNWPIGLKTISLQLWINEESVENEIEPLLLKQWLIEKSSRGRKIVD